MQFTASAGVALGLLALDASDYISVKLSVEGRHDLVGLLAMISDISSIKSAHNMLDVKKECQTSWSRKLDKVVSTFTGSRFHEIKFQSPRRKDSNTIPADD